MSNPLERKPSRTSAPAKLGLITDGPSSVGRILCYASFVFLGAITGFWFGAEVIPLHPIFSGIDKGVPLMAWAFDMMCGGTVRAIIANRVLRCRQPPPKQLVDITSSQ